MLTKRSLLLAAAALMPLLGAVRLRRSQGSQEASAWPSPTCRPTSSTRSSSRSRADAKEKGIEVITVDAKGDAATQVSQVQDSITAEHRRADLHPGRRHGGRRADQGRQGGRHPGHQCRPQRRRRARRHLHRHRQRRLRARPSATTSSSRPAARARWSSSTARRAPRPRSTAPRACGEALAANPGIKVVGELWSEGWHQDEGFKLTQDMLQAHPDVSIVFGQADALALGAAQAVKVANLGHKVWVAGFDGDVAALKAVKDGVVRRHRDAADPEAWAGWRSIRRSSSSPARRSRPSSCRTATLTTKDNVEQFIANHPVTATKRAMIADERSAEGPCRALRAAAVARATGRSRCSTDATFDVTARRGRGACSARTAPASRPCPTSSPASFRPDAGSMHLAGAALRPGRRRPRRSPPASA